MSELVYKLISWILTVVWAGLFGYLIHDMIKFHKQCKQEEDKFNRLKQRWKLMDFIREHETEYHKKK